MEDRTPSSPMPSPTPDPAIIVLATGNPHKVREITAIMNRAAPEARLRFMAASEFSGIAEPEETGATFEANALLKARYWAGKTGHLALADDSGLVVDALDGRPGVLSARYDTTAERRNERVLRELRGVAPECRRARFVCVAALADPSGEAACAEGRIEGWITEAPRGAGGFGYDPIFEPARDPDARSIERAGRTLAEYSESEKNEVSHRGRAFAELAARVAQAADSGRVTQDR